MHGDQLRATPAVTVDARTTDPDPPLIRGLGRWDLLALVINGVVGAGIFGLPAKVQALLGAVGLWAIVLCAAMIALVVLCFAELASRYDQTGGPYVYAGAAFGPFVGVATGWVLWFARITGCCAICNLLLDYLGYFDSAWSQGLGRVATAGAIIGGLSVIHYLGVRLTALFGNVFTIGKLLPLLVFIGFGLAHIDIAQFQRAAIVVSNQHVAEAVLFLSFAFVGWESAVVTAGETQNPKSHLPFALIAGIAVVAALYLLIQFVCIGTLPGLADSTRPLVDAALRFLGRPGAALIAGGAAVSMLGTLNGAMLTVSRLPYAMAAAGQLPALLARTHRRFRTPHVAVVSTGVLVLALTLSGRFVYLLKLSTISRLLVFAVSCVALLQLRRRPDAPPARFVLRAGVAISLAALALIAWLLASSIGQL